MLTLATRLRVPLALIWCLLAGCLQVEQTLTLNPDGTGRLDVRYGMSKEAFDAMRSMAAEQMGEQNAEAFIAPDMPFDFDEEEIRKDFEEYAEYGITLDDVRSEDADGWKYINLSLLFKSLEGLGQTEFVADRSVVLRRNEDGNYELRQGAPASAPVLPEMDEAMTQMMAEMLKGFRAVIRVHAPSTILESNADTVDGQTATWEFDLARDAKAFERVQQLNLRLVFDGKGLDLPTYGSAEPEFNEKH